jgi:eukaryotic-like serine/threonine-protein kinase
MSNPRDPSVDGRSRPGTRPVRDPTESLAAEDPNDVAYDEDMEALSSSQAPMGTHDAPGRAATRIESPAARNRTPHPPTPAKLVDSGRKSRPSKPPPNKGSAERPEERIGSVLGSYRLGELLGRGGMGFVYKAEHVKLGRPVALKLLRADYARRRDSVARFIREAQAVNRIRHRNIVDVPDVVELDDGTTFIIMELLEGKSLGKWAKEGFSIPRALALLVQICDGLGAAHAVGIVHRDLKPDNVIVVPTGDGAELIKLLDFGVAKLLNHDDEDIGLVTQAGSVIGTPAYMSPEQAGGLTVDVRSDIYSLGAIMYELFCGQPMFKGRSFGEFVRKHLNEQPVPPRQTAGGAALDERLETVILRCIEKEPSRRYPVIGELRDDLLHLLGGIDTQVGMVRELAGTDSLSSKDLLPAQSSRRNAPLPSSLRTPAPLPTAIATAPRRWPWVVGSVVILGAATVTATIALSGNKPTASSPREELRPAPTLAVEPIAPARPARPVGAAIVPVLFESSPSADVFVAGSATKQCSTPCTVSIDPADGGNPNHRDFIVRASGFVEQTVTIDLANAPPSVAVSLERRRRVEVAAPPSQEPRRVETAPPPPLETAIEPTPPPPEQVEPAPPVEPNKPDGKPDKKKIDRTQTLDPFRQP